ncbi:MAG: YbbR-like domain-containing protein [Bacteroidales bacterium]|nr:YbbR-like domain-containing protein [Bacteroidales bacterium]
MAFLFFLVLSAFFWLLIKLSDKYTVTYNFKLQFTDVPAELWMPTKDTHEIKVSIHTTGYNILKVKLLKSANPSISIPLNQVPYRRQNGNLYSISAQSLREELSGSLNIDGGELLFNENEIFFRLEKLQSKTVDVKLNNALQFRKQYELYSEPIIKPQRVQIYGPKALLDSITFIETEKLHQTEVFENFSTNLKLAMPSKDIKAEVDNIHVEVDVASFTEASAMVEIEIPGQTQLRLFPAEARVFYNIALRDFDLINEQNIRLQIDTSMLSTRPALLKVVLTASPSAIKIKRIVPDQVEYLIMKN